MGHKKPGQGGGIRAEDRRDCDAMESGSKADEGAVRMIVHIDRMIRHLETQISVAKKLKSEWVYITLPQAEKCLELAKAEDVIMDMFNEDKSGEKKT